MAGLEDDSKFCHFPTAGSWCIWFSTLTLRFLLCPIGTINTCQWNSVGPWAQGRSSINTSLIPRPLVEGPLGGPGVEDPGGQVGVVRLSSRRLPGGAQGPFMWPGPARWGASASLQASASDCLQPLASSPWPPAVGAPLPWGWSGPQGIMGPGGTGSRCRKSSLAGRQWVPVRHQPSGLFGGATGLAA